MIKLTSNPTCILTDADNLTPEQRQKINLNLTKDIPGSDIEGDKVTVINSNGEVEMKAYSAGGGGGSSEWDSIWQPLYIYDDSIEKALAINYDSSTMELSGGALRPKGAPYFLDYNPSAMYVPDLAELRDIIDAGRPIFLRFRDGNLPDIHESVEGNWVCIPATHVGWANISSKGEWIVEITFQTHTIGSYNDNVREITTEEWGVYRNESTRPGESVPTHTTSFSYTIKAEKLNQLNTALKIPAWGENGADIGKVLKINSDNELEWVTP